jgi:hypothetical protein
MISWIHKELKREPPVYEDDTSTPPLSDTTPSSVVTSPRTKSVPKRHHGEREPLTPEPFLISHFKTPRPIEPETLQDYSTQKENGKHSTTPPSKPQHSVTTERPSKRNSNATPFYGVLPTRFPISTSKPKHTTTSISDVNPKSSATTEDTEVYVDVYSSNPSNKFACPPPEGPQSVNSLNCQSILAYISFTLGSDANLQT